MTPDELARMFFDAGWVLIYASLTGFAIISLLSCWGGLMSGRAEKCGDRAGKD